jgi:hypothetical protein
MHEIEVRSVSEEEVSYGVAELWAAGQPFAFTILIDGDLMLRIPPSRDGDPVMIGVRSLIAALAEVDRLLA